MTTQLADEIEALAKEATPGPWWTTRVEMGGYDCMTDSLDILSNGLAGTHVLTRDLGNGKHNKLFEANAALIVALVNNRAAIVAALRERDALKAEVERLRGALEPFAKGANAFDTITPGGLGRPCPDAATYCEGAEVTVGDFRRARAALGGAG